MPKSMIEVHRAGHHRQYPRKRCPFCQNRCCVCCFLAGIERAGTPRGLRLRRLESWGQLAPARADGNVPQAILCEACWSDPALEYQKCKHGAEGAAAE
jgi:hypothetical protein